MQVIDENSLPQVVPFFFFISLTVLTQIGGIIYLLSIWVSNKWQLKTKSKLKLPLTFISIYLIATFLIVPYIAPLFGRQKIDTNENLRPATYMTILLNRNYVKKELNIVLQQLSEKTPLIFLDANFPFIDKFPLLPHLSHSDGRKVDLSYIYEDKNGKLTHKTKSNSGYGVFEGPIKSEINQIDICKSLGYFQYDYPKYLTFGTKNHELKLSKSGNRDLINKITSNEKVGKVFIEPHLVKRLNLENPKIRYHGCQAVRHDDHIHIQLK